MENTIVGIVGVLIGILLSNVLTAYLDYRRRRERIVDVQTALRAEIRSYRRWLEPFRSELDASAIARRSQPTNVSLVPKEIQSFIFEAIVSEIHILPSDVIDPVVVFYRQVRALSQFAEDLRSERFEKIDAAQKARMYEDYFGIGVFALELADRALSAIEGSLDVTSRWAAAPSDRKAGSAVEEAGVWMPWSIS